MQAGVALAADGLNGRFLQGLPEFAVRIAGHARVGAGAAIDDDSDFYEEGTIYMISSQDGYVGLVRLEDGRLDVAAAMDREAVRRARGPGALAVDLLRQAGLPVPDRLNEAPWRGTPPLTRRRLRIAADRVLAVGDAAGYVEPFTGEGMAWALHSAILAAPLAMEGIERWTPDLSRRWESLHCRWIARRQRLCRMVRRLLRSPWAAAAAVALLAKAPWLAAPLVASMNRLPFKTDSARPPFLDSSAE